MRASSEVRSRSGRRRWASVTNRTIHPSLCRSSSRSASASMASVAEVVLATVRLDRDLQRRDGEVDTGDELAGRRVITCCRTTPGSDSITSSTFTSSADSVGCAVSPSLVRPARGRASVPGVRGPIESLSRLLDPRQAVARSPGPLEGELQLRRRLDGRQIAQRSGDAGATDAVDLDDIESGASVPRRDDQPGRSMRRLFGDEHLERALAMLVHAVQRGGERDRTACPRGSRPAWRRTAADATWPATDRRPARPAPARSTPRRAATGG